MRLASLAALAAALSVMPAIAQDASPTGDTPPPAPTEVPAGGGSSAARQVYAPADFARYAPNNAYDMLRQVPSFQIRDNENLRGLGQATGLNSGQAGQLLTVRIDERPPIRLDEFDHCDDSCKPPA